MAAGFYPLFREYSLVVQNWLRNLLDLPYLTTSNFNITKIILQGTTIAILPDGKQTDGKDQHEVHLDTVNHKLKPSESIRLYDTTKITTGSGNQAIIKDNDDWYIILAVKDNIIIIDKTHKRLTQNQSEIGGKLKKVINVIYAEMKDSIARIASPLRNGLIQTPGVSFYLSDMTPKEGTRPKENYYIRRYYDKDCNKKGSAAVPPMQEYQLTYSINIWSPYRSYMSILQYQILSEFVPEKYFWIPGFGVNDDKYGFDFTDKTNNCRYDREHHGQWAHSLLEGVSDASDLEGTNIQVTFRTEITIQFTNAFMPLPFNREQNYIGEIDINPEIIDINITQHIEDYLNKL